MTSTESQKVETQVTPVVPVVAEDGFDELLVHFADVVAKSRQFITKLKVMQKAHRTLFKNQSTGKKRKAPSSSDAPAGFNKPVLVRADLARFLEIEPDVPTTRTNVTKLLTKVFKDNDLQNPANRREILLDLPAAEPLRVFFPDLLKEDAERLSFFNLQRYLKPFFLPTVRDPEVRDPEEAHSAESSSVPENVVRKVVIRRVVKKN